MDESRGMFARTSAPLKPDVILEVDGTEFETERSLLAAKSPYFAAMFSGNFKENAERKIVIKGVTPTSMKIVLDSVVEESVYVDDVDLVPTLQAACMLQFENVRDYCVTTIVETLSHDSCLDVYFAAVRLDLPTLGRKALCVALSEFRRVIDTRSFLELSVDQVHSYLSHRALHVDSEIDVFEAAMKWWYENERDVGDCVHGRRDAAGTDATVDDDDDVAAADDRCAETLLTLLRCVDYNRLDAVDMNLLPTYPGISEHGVVKDVVECVISIKRGTRAADSEAAADDRIVKFARRLLEGGSRTVPKVPCIIGVVKCSPGGVDKVDDGKTVQKCQSMEKSFVLYYDRLTDELKPLIELKHVGGDGPDLEGYRIEMWKNKLLVLGGEFMYGFGNWSRSCWSYDTTKDKWSRLTTLPSVRRHFKTCIVRDELYVIGGTGQYRVVQNNMDRYNLKTDVWSGSIAFPYEVYDIECCEHRGTLFMTCGSRSKIETLSYDPDSGKWTRLRITDPHRLYKNVGPKDTVQLSASTKNFKSYVPFVIGDDLYISGNYLLGLRQRSLDMEVFYFGAGVETYEDGYESVGACVIGDVVFSFCFDETNAHATGITYNNLVRQFDMATKRRVVSEIQNKDVRLKHSTGCFSLFDYRTLSFDDTICPRDDE